MDHYSFSFITHKGEAVDVHIYDTESTTAKEKTLIPSATPLTITMQQSDNPMEPVRYTSAKINVLCKSGDVLDLTNNLRYFVRVNRSQKDIFIGFLRAEAYTQGYSSTEETFTYNAVDFLGAAESMKLNEETLTMLDVVRRIASELHSPSGKLIVGNSLPRKDGGRVITTLNLKTRAENWRQEDEDRRTQTYASALDFIREWCTFFGMTAFCNGEDLFIGSPDDSGYFTIGNLAALANGAAPYSIISTIKTLTFANISPSGQHSIDYKQPAQKVEMTFGGDGYESSGLPQLSFDGFDVDYTHTFNANEKVATNTKGEGFDWFVIGTKNPEKGNIRTYRRKIRDWKYTPEIIDRVTPNNLLTCAAGASFVRQDYWGTNEERDPGSAKSRDEKLNYNLEDMLYIFGMDPSTGYTIGYTGKMYGTEEEAKRDAEQTLDIRANYPLVEITSSSPVTIIGGFGICISFSSAVDSMIPLKYSMTGNAGSAMYMSLRIGNKYWNGRGWSNNFAKFQVDTQFEDTGGFDAMRDVINTKLLTQSYTCNGYSIPVTTTLSGQFELKIYAFARTFVSYEWDLNYENPHIIGYYPNIYCPYVSQIKDFTIDVCEPINRSFQKKYDNTLRLYETQEGGMDEVTAQTSLSSGKDVAENFGVVSDTQRLTNVVTGMTASAEELTFDRMKRINFRASKRVTISSLGDIPIPDTLYTHKGETYRIESASDWDVIAGTIKLKLIKTK